MNKPQIFDFVIDNAKKTLKRDHWHTPMAFLLTREKSVQIMALNFDDEEAKLTSFAILSRMLKAGKYQSYTIVSEAWLVKRKIGDPNQKRPSQCSDGVEILQISYQDEKGDSWLGCIEFRRMRNTIKIMHEEFVHADKENIGGNIPNLWR